MADFVVPRHSAVMERLRRRIELCRRHHGSCESRYDAVAGERLERERQHTLQLHQRCLQAKAKRAGKHRQPPPSDSGAGRGSQASTGNMEAGDGSGEQCRNSTLIAQLHETVKRKLDSASSPQNGEQQNGYGDLFTVPKKLRHDDGLTGVIGSSNGIPPASPLRQMDIKPPNGDSLQLNGNHSIGLDGVNKKCLPDAGLQLNGDTDEFSLCLGKEMKQEPVDDLPCMLSGVEGSISQNNLPDLNLNELEWRELIEELNKSVPDEDMGDLFSGDFEDKKDTDASNSATQTPLAQDIHVKSEFSPAFEQESIGSPQVRSASSGPYIGNSSVPAGSVSPVVGGTHAVFQPSAQTVTDSTSQPMMQTSSQAPNVQRSLPNVLMPGQAAVSAKEMSSAHQLQQIAAKQKRDQLLQNQPQVHQTNQMTNWPQSRSSQSPIGVPYNMENPTSPSVYQQDFNNQKLLMQNMNKSSPRSGGNYMQPNHVNMMGHKPSGTLNSAQVAGPNSLLDYGNTKPLSHYEADCGAVVAQNQSKTAMLTYLQRQQQQLSHMTEEQNQMFILKRKAAIPYRPLVPHGQDQNSQPGVPRVPVSASGPGVGAQQPAVSIAGNINPTGYLNSQQQAVLKQQQQLMMEQKQREQKQLLMEQQKQYLMGQRQQQLLAEQEKQRHQQEQALQRHLTRPPPQYQDQPQNSYQQQIGPFPGSSSVMPTVNNLNHPSSGSTHMFSQTQPMIPMGGGHASVSQMPSGSNSQDRTVNQYPNLQSVQRGALYNMGSGIPQMVPNHATQNNLPNGQPQIQRPPNMGQANTTLPAGYGQNPLGNAGLPPQHNKGAMNPPLPKNQIPRMPAAMVSQNPSWQHQGMQSMNSQAQGNNVLGAFTAASAGFHLQQNHHKMTNQQYGQGMSQVGLGASRSMPTINTSVPGQMMPNLASQQRTNPASQQSTPNQQVLPVMNQTVPEMAAFNQNPGQQITNRAGLHCNQNYQVRSTSQDLPFGYGNQPGNNALQNLSGDADLLDSLLKNRTSEEWMNDLDELLGNH